MSIGSQSSGPIDRWCMASVGQMATQCPQSMQRSHPFGIGTGNWSMVMRPPGQARTQLPQPMQRLSSALIIVFVSLRSFMLVILVVDALEPASHISSRGPGRPARGPR